MKSADEPEVVVMEDVWGLAFDELGTRYSIARDRVADPDPDRVSRLIAPARALVVRNQTRVNSELLESAPNLELVARAGVGLDNIDVEAAARRGVVVVAPRDANSVSVAEHALGLALALARRLVSLDLSTRRGEWERLPGRELAGRIWGIIGAGATGQATARLAMGIGMKILAYDPLVDSAVQSQIGYEFTSLGELVRAADVVSIHVPATPVTRGLVDASALAQMKPEALLINVGRGDVIDEDAVVAALRSGRLGGAGLDVRTTEPPVTGFLEELPNVVLTPHVAGMTWESQERIATALAVDIDRVLRGLPALHAVEPGLQGSEPYTDWKPFDATTPEV